MTTDSTIADATRSETGLDPAAACTLSPGGISDRLAWIRSEILPHAITSESSPDGIVWELEDAPDLAAKLDRLVALERECCSGIEFEHATSATRGRRRLEVRGIDPRSAVFASLQGAASPSGKLGGRVAKAAGFGTLLSLAVCCALPIGAVALFGAAAAAPLASLDDPWMIAGSALLFGGAAFAWQVRRRASTPASGDSGESCGPGC